MIELAIYILVVAAIISIYANYRKVGDNYYFTSTIFLLGSVFVFYFLRACKKSRSLGPDKTSSMTLTAVNGPQSQFYSGGLINITVYSGKTPVGYTALNGTGELSKNNSDFTSLELIPESYSDGLVFYVRSDVGWDGEIVVRTSDGNILKITVRPRPSDEYICLKNNTAFLSLEEANAGCDI